MMKITNKISRNGFTLIEMMITVLIFAVVTLSLTELLTRQGRTYTVVENIAEAQQNIRSLAKFVERDMRSTGFLVPEGGAICGYDTRTGTADNDPDVLFVTDADAIDPAGMATLQLGASVTAGSGNNFSGNAETFTLATLDLEGTPFYDLNNDGTPDSDFLFFAPPGRAGGVIFVDRNNPAAGTACGLITAINIGASTIRVDFTVNGNAIPENFSGSGGLDIVAIPAHVYWVAGLPANPVLMRDNQVISPDIEDLQLALFYDLDDDGVVDNRPAGNVNPPYHSSTEYPGSGAPGAEYVPGSGNWDNAQLSEIRVTLIARTRTEDPDVLQNPAMGQQQAQALENRQLGAVAPDGFRRRVISMTVAPRNVGSRASGL